MGNATLRESKRLYDLGFAVHWLRPKSKMPLESGWTTGERKDWEYLKKTYSEPLNVGVRLGHASKIDGIGYLCVIDVDVKSTDDEDRKAALKRVKDLIGDAKCPVVLSGRGNGSRHYYCVTAKPFPPYDYVKSEKTVKVLMPSTPPSKKEKETLTEAELARGYRLRKAWEISVMSEGRQVVLPPSVHPDSGKPYTWKRGFEDIRALPILPLERENDSSKVIQGKREATLKLANSLDNFNFQNADYGQFSGVPPIRSADTSKEMFEFEVTPVDLALVENLSARIRAGILVGKDVEDRSAFLLPACTALHSAGLSRDEILTVLTEPKTFLGACAYEHAQTKDRTRAARWVWRYTLRKVMEERSAESMFRAVANIEPAKKLTKDESLAQAEDLGVDEDDPEERGYYIHGPRGAKEPDYDALLRAFRDLHPFKTIADMGAAFIWNGTHYEACDQIEMKHFVEKKMTPRPTERFRAEFVAKVHANNVKRRNFFFDTTEGKINFKNGVLDLSAGSELLPHSPEFGFRGVLPYGYDPEAKCPFFKKWLHSIMKGDEDLMAVLQEFMGYIVRGGDYKYHKALWLGGVGRNGKSTFVDLLKALVGFGNYSTISIKSLINDKFAGSELDGKIANFSEETSPQELADSGPFKNLTGDGELSAQKKFGDLYSFRNRAKLIMTYNEIPDLKDLSPGMLSRPIIIPFKKRIKEEELDRNIKAKLFAELPGIFNFALRGWTRLERNAGFTYSAASAAALRRIKEESCSAYQWVENCVEFSDEGSDGEGRVYTSTELFAAYVGRNKFHYSQKKFERRINAHPEIKSHRIRREKGVVYFGLTVK